VRVSASSSPSKPNLHLPLPNQIFIIFSFYFPEIENLWPKPSSSPFSSSSSPSLLYFRTFHFFSQKRTRVLRFKGTSTKHTVKLKKQESKTKVNFFLSKNKGELKPIPSFFSFLFGSYTTILFSFFYHKRYVMSLIRIKIEIQLVHLRSYDTHYQTAPQPFDNTFQYSFSKLDWWKKVNKWKVKRKNNQKKNYEVGVLEMICYLISRIIFNIQGDDEIICFCTIYNVNDLWVVIVLLLIDLWVAIVAENLL